MSDENYLAVNSVLGFVVCITYLGIIRNEVDVTFTTL